MSDHPADHDAPTPADATDEVAAALRGSLTPLLQQLAGVPPRPFRLTQGLGLDKSIASRLVKAVRADNDLDFLHQVPSPTGLRLLLQQAKGRAEPRWLQAADVAVRRFEALLDALPGGRQALDAQMGESSSGIRERREQMARQASFKAQSFLFGHFCESLTTTMVAVPSATPGLVDVLEVHRRRGLQRLVPSMPLPLLSVSPGSSLAEPGPAMLPLQRDTPSADVADYLLTAGCSQPLPELSVVQEGALTTFVLPAGPSVAMPTRLTTAWRVLRAEAVHPAVPWLVLRNYMLHTPCRTLVRELFVADGLWPDAMPQLGFFLPGPSGTPFVPVEPGRPHLRRVNLTARIEQLPPGTAGFEMEGFADHPATLQEALAPLGVRAAQLRGWRCSMAYPVPLIETQVALRFTGA